MKSNEELYYEQELHWDPDWIAPADVARVRSVRRAIPQDVKSILDFGCGNGIFANLANEEGFAVVALDRSDSALRYVRGATVRGEGSRLPFRNRSFDMVVSLEVLEHLPYTAYGYVRREIARVSRRYILVTVPYRQNLEEGLLPCPACQCRFNPTYHMRSYDELSLQGLFRGGNDQFLCCRVERLGTVEYLRSVGPLRGVLNARARQRYPPTAICPQCGFRPGASEKRAAHSARLKSERQTGLKRRIGFERLIRGLWPKGKRPRWYLALYQRAGAEG